MRFLAFILILTALHSCDLIRLLNTSEEKDESREEIKTFLAKHKYKYDYSFENIDTSAFLLRTPKYRINNDSLRYSYIQLRVFDSKGDLYSGYSQCMGNFNKKKFIDSFPPTKNSYPFLNKELKFKNELDLIDVNPNLKIQIQEQVQKYDYTFVVYYTIWTNYFSEHVLREVSKIKATHPDKVMVILVNVAKNVSKPNINN